MAIVFFLLCDEKFPQIIMCKLLLRILLEGVHLADSHQPSFAAHIVMVYLLGNVWDQMAPSVCALALDFFWKLLLAILITIHLILLILKHACFWVPCLFSMRIIFLRVLMSCSSVVWLAALHILTMKLLTRIHWIHILIGICGLRISLCGVTPIHFDIQTSLQAFV